MAGKKKKMTLGEARSISPAQQRKLDRGYQDYQKKRILETGGEGAIIPKKKWVDIWKGDKKYK